MGFKEKLPLLKSSHKSIRLSGYLLYIFLVITVLGAILPSPGVDDSPTTTTTTTVSTQDLDISTSTKQEIDCRAVKDELDRARTIYWQNGATHLTPRQKELIDHCGTGRERDYAVPTVKKEEPKTTIAQSTPAAKAEEENIKTTSAPVATITPNTQVRDGSGVLDVASVKDLLSNTEKAAEVRVNRGNVAITREMRDNLNNDWMLRGAKIHSIDIFKSLFKDTRVDKVTVTSTISLIDEYGQTSTTTGTVYTMTRATYQQINWDRFINDNLDKVADGVYIHPVFSK
jgi:hypothetical protein